MIVNHKFNIVTDASGDFTATSERSFLGRLISVDYAFNGLDATADTTLSYTGGAGVSRNLVVFTNSQATASSAVVADAIDVAGAASGQDVHPFVDGKLVLTVAQGGNATSGTFVAYVEV